MLNSGIWPAFFIFPVLVFMAVKISSRILSRKKWDKYLKHWRKLTAKYQYEDDHLAGILTSNNPQLLEKPLPASEPDIYDYGAAKLLICEHDMQVDWLVMNRFHTENGVVIISENFYPHYLKEQVQELIKTNPNLEIYALHNTGHLGESMISRLRNPINDWELLESDIIDLGLSSEHLSKTKLNKKIIEQYNGNFPAHGITYHQFHPLLKHCLIHGLTFAATYAALNANSEIGVSGDFG
jgi:hypothetical protein